MPHRKKNVFRAPGLHVLLTKDMGLGVFAGKRIRKGTIIERCPVLPLTRSEERKVQSISLRDYIFAWGKRPCLSCIVLGWGSLYNHSDAPNATYYQMMKSNQIKFVALRDIKKGEQILIDYEWDAEEYPLCGIQPTNNGQKKAANRRRRK